MLGTQALIEAAFLFLRELALSDFFCGVGLCPSFFLLVGVNQKAMCYSVLVSSSQKMSGPIAIASMAMDCQLRYNVPDAYQDRRFFLRPKSLTNQPWPSVT